MNARPNRVLHASAHLLNGATLMVFLSLAVSSKNLCSLLFVSGPHAA